MIVSVTSAGDVFFRINLQDGYQILDQTRLLMRYTSEINSRSRNMTSEQAFVNASSMFLEVPRSRVPYPRFQVQVALQVGNEVGQFVSDDETHGKHVDTCPATHCIVSGMKVTTFTHSPCEKVHGALFCLAE